MLLLLSSDFLFGIEELGLDFLLFFPGVMQCDVIELSALVSRYGQGTVL